MMNMKIISFEKFWLIFKMIMFLMMVMIMMMIENNYNDNGSFLNDNYDSNHYNKCYNNSNN